MYKTTKLGLNSIHFVQTKNLENFPFFSFLHSVGSQISLCSKFISIQSLIILLKKHEQTRKFMNKYWQDKKCLLINWGNNHEIMMIKNQDFTIYLTTIILSTKLWFDFSLCIIFWCHNNNEHHISMQDGNIYFSLPNYWLSFDYYDGTDKRFCFLLVLQVPVVVIDKSR